MIDKQKFWNNRVMDELVEKLGYMDYRDALACNKYILESKRHTDYHQQARSKLLSIAMAKYSALKKADLEAKVTSQVAAAEVPNAAQDRDETKLRLIMNTDPDMSALYQEAYGQIKDEKEREHNEATRIFEKFAY